MKDSLLADIFYKLAEVAEGKKEIDDVIKEVTNDDKNAGWLKEKYNEFSSFVSNLRNNIRSEYDKAKKFNDLDREYDMRNTVSVKLPNGQEGYSVGKPRDKSIKEDARDYAKGLFNDLGDLTSEKIGFKDFAKRRAEEARRSVARSTKLNSVLDAAGRGFINGVNKTLNELRGIGGSKPKNEPKKEEQKLENDNRYANLSDEKLMFSVAQAYDNICMMQLAINKGDLPKEEQDKLYADMDKLMASAKERFPDVKSAENGKFFTDSKVANYEAALYGFMSEKGKEFDLDNSDMMRYSKWRQGEDFTMPMGGKTYSERPFHNISRYCSSGEAACFRDPYESAQNRMTREEFAAERAKISKLNLR